VDTALSATVQGSWFETNYAWIGGGLFSQQAIAIRQTTFQNNSAGYGGGVSGTDFDIQNSDFWHNAADNMGGGLRIGGKATVSSSRFISNTARYGGGVDVTVGADAALINNVIADNRANYTAGGLYTEAAMLLAWHTTLARNSSGDGTGATFGTDWSGLYGTVAVMTNTILFSQTLAVSVTVNSTATLNGVLWYSNTANIKGIGFFTVTNELTGTPAFASDGYHLTANSKAINTGVPAGVINDLDGEARDAAPDLGADEYRTCWARLNNDATDYGHAQVAVDASTQATDVVKVAGYCPGAQPRGGAAQSIYLSKTLTIRGGYTTTNWLTSNPIAYPTVLDALHLGRVIYLTGGISATLENLMMRGGSINSSGGGVYNNGARVTLANMIVRDNAVANLYGGGGLCVASSGTLTVTASLVTSNTASYGGGIFNGGGKLVLINTTLSGNHSATSDPALDGGGAIDQWGSSPSATLINSTIVSNTAAIGNVARSGIWLEYGTLVIQNSIVAHNGVTNNLRIENGAVFTSAGYNLTNSGVGTSFTATTDLRNTNPLLGPLQDNGGATWTHALLPNSPAIDRIPLGVNGCGTTLTIDQRGQPRPGTFTHLCDSGAYEAQGIYDHVYLPLIIK
ncbi:MAG TPA: choice-of-anchor Q domain-containing protein, partial [Anaerolineae bacterium]|nr:choice-of-anchor Q domain-containing protein [Anaerolineae bacterium]